MKDEEASCRQDGEKEKKKKGDFYCPNSDRSSVFLLLWVRALPLPILLLPFKATKSLRISKKDEEDEGRCIADFLWRFYPLRLWASSSSLFILTQMSRRQQKCHKRRRQSSSLSSSSTPEVYCGFRLLKVQQPVQHFRGSSWVYCFFFSSFFFQSSLAWRKGFK